MPEAFTYIWTNTLTDRVYVGWHKGDVDDGYVCSSKVLMEEYLENPLVFSRKIIGYGACKEMKNLESEILNFFDARCNKKFYNQTNANGNFLHTEKHTLDSKIKMSLAHVTRTKYAKGWKMTQSSKNKCELSAKNRWQSDEERNKLSASMKKSEKFMSFLKIHNKLITVCPHCNKSGQNVAMKRWHFSNCKSK
jgi:hypothetical protein